MICNVQLTLRIAQTRQMFRVFIKLLWEILTELVEYTKY